LFGEVIGVCCKNHARDITIPRTNMWSSPPDALPAALRLTPRVSKV